MSLKIRLVLILSAVLSIGIALGAAVLWLHARAAMRSEMDTTLRSAERLISAVRSQPGLTSLRPEDLAESLDRLRHVRVIRPEAGPLPPENTDVAGVPRWFSRLFAPGTEGFEPINLTVGSAHEQVILQADPSDEIREVWQDVRVLMVIAAALFLCVGGLVYLGLARGLRPLAELEAAFDRLESQDLETRVPEAAVPELARIHKRFNRMAAVLCATRDRERTLASHLIDVQEAERRGLARELHDDLAPLLFTASVYLTTIQNHLETRQYGGIQDSLAAIEHTVAELQGRIRAMLRRLRPQGLDALGLDQALRDLVETWRSRQGHTDWTIETSGLRDDLDDTLRVTIYRIVQECLTNVARHAGARHASVRVTVALVNPATVAPNRIVEIQVEDDGKGMVPEVSFGLGLTGIEERVQALGGALTLTKRHPQGLCVRAWMPLQPGRSDSTSEHSRLATSPRP
ncbi:MAG: histidine kinase [Pseudomonadota bacterium]|nr:histidine kinase [Pseudomonadota bacterium]